MFAAVTGAYAAGDVRPFVCQPAFISVSPKVVIVESGFLKYFWQKRITSAQILETVDKIDQNNQKIYACLFFQD